MGGRREDTICKYCGKVFKALLIKKRQGKALFCSKDCYFLYRKANAKNPKTLNKLYQKKHKYNLNEEQYHQMILDSNNRCAICNSEFDTTKRNGVNIDHSHETGKVRGLLCHNCNSLLGHAHDNINVLKNAIKYLEKYK